MKTALVVLGMHRSGTSSVAGTLFLLGAAAPKTLMPPHGQNPKGFWESLPVTQLNDVLLAERGIRWHDWRARSSSPATSVDPRITEMLRQEFGGDDLALLKDPRMCRLFPEWKAALIDMGYEPKIIMPLRKPAEVADSLYTRDSFTRDVSLRLWLRNVLEAEKESRGLRRHLMTWPDFMADWRHQIEIMSARLGAGFSPGVAASGTSVDEFLTPELHRERTDAAVQGMVAGVWEVMCRLARHGEHPDLLRELDDYRANFERACTLFADAP